MAEESPPAVEKRKKGAPHRKMTAAEETDLSELLKRPDIRLADGSVDVATIAKMTGRTYQQVYYFLRRNPYWHSQAREARVDAGIPTEAEAIGSPPSSAPPGILMSPEDFANAQAILRQQKKMIAKDWKGLGMDEKMAARMEKLSTVGAAPLVPVIQMLYGGLIKHVATLDEVLEGDAERIKNNLLPAELDKEGKPADDGKVQREWRYCWYAGYKLHLELFNSMQKTQAMLARLMREMKELGMNSKSPEKGVYETVVSERKPDSEA